MSEDKNCVESEDHSYPNSNNMLNVKITGTGIYLPEKKVLSEDLEREHQIPAGWALKNSGVASRHNAVWESGSFMAARALKETRVYCPSNQWP